MYQNTRGLAGRRQTEPTVDTARANHLLQRARRTGVSTAGKLTPAGQDLWAALWAYGFKSVQAILRDGALKSRLMALGVSMRGLDRVGPSEWEAIGQRGDVREQLASEMNLLAWPRFANKVVHENYWQPEQSQLTTLWVNACLLRAVPVVTRWARGQANTRFGTNLHVKRQMPNAFVRFEDAEQYKDLVRSAPDKVREVLELLLADYDYDEIADALGIRTTTVANRLYRYRKDIVLPKLLRGELHAPRGHVLQEIAERLEIA
jgi:hypothetical protein